MTIRSLRTASFILLAACSTPRAASAQGGAGFLECAADLQERPAEYATSECVYDHGVAEDDREEASGILRDLAARVPQAGWPVYFQAMLAWGDQAVAQEFLARAAHRFAAAGDLDGEVIARGNRQRLLFDLGRIDEAHAEAKRAASVAPRSDDPTVRARGHAFLGRHLVMVGEDLERAYGLLRRADRTLPADGSYSLRREVLSYLGTLEVELGRLADAEDANRRLLDLAQEAGDARGEAIAFYGLARVAIERLVDAPTPRRRAEVIDLTREALGKAEAAVYPGVMSKAHWVLGLLGPRKEAARHFDLCVDLADAAGDKIYCRNALARHLARKDPQAAAEVIDETLQLGESLDSSWSDAFTWREVMRVRWAAEEPDSALEASWQALDKIERLRDLQPEGSAVQADLFSTWSDDYAWLAGRVLEEAGVGLARGRATAEAFLVNERMRARALTDWLRRADPKEADRGEAATEFSGLEQVQAGLAPREALLSFQVAPWEDLSGDFGGGSWVIAVTRGGVDFHRLPGRVELRRAVGLFEGLLERRDGSEAGVAARVYEQLLEDALAGLPPEVDRLILVPDDALHRLPFAALRPAAGAEPLGARYELVRVPSATLWLDWRRAEPSSPARPLLVLADPDSPEAGGAPEGSPLEAQAAGRPEVQVAQVRDAAQALGRLPHARREGRAAVRALGGGRLLVGAEASEARFAGLPLADFGLVHFAAHAVTDEDRPERSAVLLASGGGHDGLLQGAEIAGLDLAGRTVVLASCRSASGTVLRGEGVMSLARAFFQAGAHGVVASLWPLRDDESAALFGRFYGHVGRGATVAEALHRARREAIDAGEPAAAWAGLVVLGDGSVAPVPEGRRALEAFGPAAWAAGALLAGLLGAALAWFLARRSRSRPS